MRDLDGGRAPSPHAPRARAAFALHSSSAGTRVRVCQRKSLRVSGACGIGIADAFAPCDPRHGTRDRLLLSPRVSPVRTLLRSLQRRSDRAVIHLVTRLVRPGDRVADVGANVGFYSRLLARLVGATGG